MAKNPKQLKKPVELAKFTWEFNGKTYYQVDSIDEAESGRYSAMAIEEGTIPNDDGEYRCVEIYFIFGDDGKAKGIEEVKKSSMRWDGINGGFAGGFDEFLTDGMTIEEFADAVRGCDCMEANVMGNIDIGSPYFTFDCDMMGPNGRVCVSGTMLKDEEGLITDVEDMTFRDYSEMEDGGSFEDAPIIDDPDEIGGILPMLASRFTHDGGDEGNLPPGVGCWSL